MNTPPLLHEKGLRKSISHANSFTALDNSPSSPGTPQSTTLPNTNRDLNADSHLVQRHLSNSDTTRSVLKEGQSNARLSDPLTGTSSMLSVNRASTAGFRVQNASMGHSMPQEGAGVPNANIPQRTMEFGIGNIDASLENVNSPSVASNASMLSARTPTAEQMSREKAALAFQPIPLHGRSESFAESSNNTLERVAKSAVVSPPLSKATTPAQSMDVSPPAAKAPTNDVHSRFEHVQFENKSNDSTGRSRINRLLRAFCCFMCMPCCADGEVIDQSNSPPRKETRKLRGVRYLQQQHQQSSEIIQSTTSVQSACTCSSSSSSASVKKYRFVKTRRKKKDNDSKNFDNDEDFFKGRPLAQTGKYAVNQGISSTDFSPSKGLKLMSRKSSKNTIQYTTDDDENNIDPQRRTDAAGSAKKSESAVDSKKNKKKHGVNNANGKTRRKSNLKMEKIALRDGQEGETEGEEEEEDSSYHLDPDLDPNTDAPYYARRVDPTATCDSTGTSSSATSHSVSSDSVRSGSGASQLENVLRVFARSIYPDALPEELGRLYVFTGLLGWGGNGMVGEARSRVDGSIVAVKFLSRHCYDEEQLVPDPQVPTSGILVPMEAAILRQIRHEHIVRLYGHYQNEEYFILVMEKAGNEMDTQTSGLLESNSDPAAMPFKKPTPAFPPYPYQPSAGELKRPAHSHTGSMYDYLKKYGTPSMERARSIFKQILSAYQELERCGFVYLDFKPENVLISSTHHVKLIDFSMSQPRLPDIPIPTSTSQPSTIPSASTSQQSHNFITLFADYGTREFSSPEILLGRGYRGPEADMYALGRLLFILVSGGRTAFRNEQEVIKGVITGWCTIPSKTVIDKDCVDLIERMLCMDPKRRLGTAEVRRHPWVLGGG